MPVGIVSEPHAVKLGRVVEIMSGFPYCEVLIFNDHKLHWSFVTQHRTFVWDLHTNLTREFVGKSNSEWLPGSHHTVCGFTFQSVA